VVLAGRMSTWAGAIVETHDRADFAAVAAKYRIAISGDVTPWILVEGETNFASLCPPAFAEALSRELQCTVIAFFLQSTASVEEVEHWDNGKLLRKLQYSHDGGGWLTHSGTPQAWEPKYFFADDEGTREGATWPSNLGDEVTDEEIARYERARAANDATAILDLLSGGSARGIHRLCKHFGVRPDAAGARYTPATSWKPRIILAAIVLFFVGMVLLGALSHPHR
jgi:hypothetical protein